MIIEKAIYDRLVSGFTNWNSGYEAWEKWCDTLYKPDAHYNVYGKRLTLDEYKAQMKALLAENEMQVGDFENIIILDDWCAIRYHGTTKNKETGEYSEYQVMEFVYFKMNPDPIGVRVIEGLAQ